MIPTLCTNVDRLFTCFIRTSIAIIMFVLTSKNLGVILVLLLSHHKAPWNIRLTLLIRMFLSIIESGYYKLSDTYGFTFMITSLRAWMTISILGALTHIKITRAFSSMTPQVLDIIVGPPCAHVVVDTLYGKMHN